MDLDPDPSGSGRSEGCSEKTAQALLDWRLGANWRAYNGEALGSNRRALTNTTFELIDG